MEDKGLNSWKVALGCQGASVRVSLLRFLSLVGGVVGLTVLCPGLSRRRGPLSGDLSPCVPRPALSAGSTVRDGLSALGGAAAASHPQGHDQSRAHPLPA